jgi:chromosomal replication initiation ATPase DnaA
MIQRPSLSATILQCFSDVIYNFQGNISSKAFHQRYYSSASEASSTAETNKSESESSLKLDDKNTFANYVMGERICFNS